jgi:hypothetical protein
VKLFSRISTAFVVCLLVTVALLNSTSGSTGSSNWPQWRGPDGQGVSGETGLPVEWSNTKNVKWKTPLAGRGHSSPIVWGKKIFLTSALDGEVIPGRTAGVTHKLSDGTDFVHPDAVGANLKHTFKVICLDRDTGKILWERVAMKVRFMTAVTKKPASPLPRLRPMASICLHSSVAKVFTLTTSKATSSGSNSSASSAPPAWATESRQSSMRIW